MDALSGGTDVDHDGNAKAEQHEDLYTCRRCGWTYPNPHPSGKHRRNHKKNCGKIKGFEAVSVHLATIGGSSDEASSDEEDHEHRGELNEDSRGEHQTKVVATSLVMGESKPEEHTEDRTVQASHVQAPYDSSDQRSLDKDLNVEDVRAPNIFERAKEEVEAIKQTIHEKHDNGHSLHHGSDQSHSKDLDVEDVRAPNIFERAKEEIEAITQSIHEKHDKKKQKPSEDNHESTKAGCWTYMGKTFERICGGSQA